MTGYRSGGARALVELHARHLTAFVETWRGAKRDGVALPATEDPDCASLDALLRHVLSCARHYMVWLCDKLELPDPGIRPLPEDPDRAAAEVDDYLAHLLERWDGPLVELDEPTVERATFTSGWGVDYCVDGMLEHAVMHPLRHEYQIQRAR